MKEIKKNNPVINWQINGEGEIVLLFVHGAFIDQQYWQSQVDYFSKNYTVVTIDLPGHGKSGKERIRWTVENFAEDVIFVIRELNLKNVILIGHSMAGDINLVAATSNPASFIGFIGIDNFKNAATTLTPDYRQQADDIIDNIKTDFAATCEQYARTALLTPQTPPQVANRIIGDYRKGWQPMGVEIIAESFNMDKLEARLLPELQLTLHLINADYMPTNEEALKRYAINGYDLVEIKGTSHFPMLENPDELNRLLEQTIYKIEHANAVV